MRSRLFLAPHLHCVLFLDLHSQLRNWKVQELNKQLLVWQTHSVRLTVYSLALHLHRNPLVELETCGHMKGLCAEVATQCWQILNCVASRLSSRPPHLHRVTLCKSRLHWRKDEDKFRAGVMKCADSRLVSRISPPPRPPS